MTILLAALIFAALVLWDRREEGKELPPAERTLYRDYLRNRL